jgi:hypothetical protein
MMTISVRKKLDALSTVWPTPLVAATISAATSVVQPKPIAILILIRISGSEAGNTTNRTTCQWHQAGEGNERNLGAFIDSQPDHHQRQTNDDHQGSVQVQCLQINQQQTRLSALLFLAAARESLQK